ncbi:hypothetical protein PAXRUDRAFT_835059 [Paxillus rubicundulus Ve08.2h10]|uniref:protein-histidine N-methyltransferase n=1 Tax=Paxillus rubicundulus Ve08.2h10 TaxID=930991 RepID=A0A0D0DGX6_9AGAM|nr:hypothetical protein PAXRUDRAFT_835059 [Paxillus rubicundulus Ve08.2h10]
MFRFNFDFDEGADEVIITDFTNVSPKPVEVDDAPLPSQQAAQPFLELSLDSLLEVLPTQISYSLLTVPLSDGNDLKLARRDLFDARFQLISEGTGDPETTDQKSEPKSTTDSALQFLDNPSDLVPFVYEGGLKTWECSIDLAGYLNSTGYGSNTRGTRILELGCGTAVPTLYILQEIFSSQPAGEPETHIHLQDYNASVLQLVTMPNVVLAWYNSPAANEYRNSESYESTDSELNMTPQLFSAFKTSLGNYGVNLRFFAGSWDTFDLSSTGGRYNLVLTSETIYHLKSLFSLIRLMRGACVAPLGDVSEDVHQYLCLVAAKTVYFGVGGGIAEFVRCVEEMTSEKATRSQVEVVWDKSIGVSRKVMSVRWAHQ